MKVSGGSLLVAAGEVTGADRRNRAILFVAWLLLVGWFLSGHVFWRDEVRAFSFALSGSNVVEMLKTVHGEGHPALWYLILRGAHDMFPYREVLQVIGAVIGIAAMAVFTWFAPFRAIVVALILFSFFGAFEYVVVARNYGIAALVMFTLAALYERVKGTLWFGAILLLLCNTNVPSCILAAMFLLFRLVEMASDGSKPGRHEWLIFIGNAAMALVGALLCFRMIYPTFNDAAVSPNYGKFGFGSIVAGLADTRQGFSNIGLGPFVLLVACLGLIVRPAALTAAVAGLVVLKLFFYFASPSGYRHEALYLVFLICLYWMSANGAGGSWRERPWMMSLQRIGAIAFLAVMAMQTYQLSFPIRMQLAHIPYSRSAEVGRLLHRPELRGAIVMADPDTMVEPIAYYADNPLYFLRQQRFGIVAQLTDHARRLLTLDDILADAGRLHRQTGRPVVFLSHLPISPDEQVRKAMMYHDYTVVTPDAAKRFLASTRLIASLRGSGTDEDYDVYVYPK